MENACIYILGLSACLCIVCIINKMYIVFGLISLPYYITLYTAFATITGEQWRNACVCPPVSYKTSHGNYE